MVAAVSENAVFYFLFVMDFTDWTSFIGLYDEYVDLVVKTPAWRSGGTVFNSQPGHVISLSKKFTHICLGQLSLSSSWGR
jgi:hypothetical protein